MLRDVLNRAARRVRHESGLPLSHIAVLSFLHQEGVMIASDIATKMHLRPQTMAIIVKNLEKNKLILRQPHPTDRRQILLEITTSGLEVIKRNLNVHGDWIYNSIMLKLNNDERRNLAQGLNIILRVIDKI